MTILSTIHAKKIELILKSAKVFVKCGLFIEVMILLPRYEQVYLL